MSRILRATLLLAVVLAIPILPLVVLGVSFEGRFEQQLKHWLTAERQPALHFTLIVAALATDIFLPIPSSAVSTYAGGSGLDFWLATAGSWLGMTLGAVLGFALARLFGHRFSSRYAGAKDLEQMAALTQRFGPLTLVLTRALPILAEACVLLMGATGLSWRRFLIPVVTANFVISITYAAFGRYFADSGAFPVAVVASGTIPLAAALVARRWLPASHLDDILPQQEPTADETPHNSARSS